MKQETEQDKIKKRKKVSIDEENPNFFKVLLVVAIITGLLKIIIIDRGDLLDLFFWFIGGLGLIVGISWIIGIIPVLILRNKMKNARITIYGVIFLLLCVLLTIGNLYGAGYLS